MKVWITKNKGQLLRAGGSLLALVLLVILLEQQGWDEIKRAVEEISLWRLLLAFALVLASRLFTVARWHVLLRSSGTPVSFWRTTAITFTGLFASNFLPTTIGGDVARLAGAIKMGVDRAIALASLIADRLVGMAGMALLLPLGLARFFAWSAGGAALSSVSLAGLWERGTRYVRRVLQSISYWAKKPGILLVSLLFTLAHMTCNISALYIILGGLHDSVSWWTIAGLSSLTYFIGLMPISINGYGLQELSVTFIYSNLAGVSAGSAFVLALLHRLFMMLASLPGAFFLPSVMSDRIAADSEGLPVDQP